MKVFINEQLDIITPDELRRAIAKLPDWRREKALRFKHEQGQKECAFAYLLLQEALSEVYDISDLNPFTIGEHGKPALAQHPTIHFNMSHCRHAVACVVSDHPVGIDIERIGRYKETLARHVLNEQEFAQVANAPNPDIEFARFWTQKEAIVKLTGRGIDDDLKNLLIKYNNVSLHTEEHLDKGYVLSVATMDAH